MNKQASSFFRYYLRVYRIALLLCTVIYLPTSLAQTQVSTPVPTTHAKAINQTTVNPKTIDDEANSVLPASAINNLSNKSSFPSENQTKTLNTIAEASPQKLAAILPHNLSPWGMFMAADWVVKAVMVSLAIASLLTWTILVSKTIELRALKRSLKHNRAKIMASHTLADVANANDIRGVGREFIEAAETELHLSADMASKEDGKEGIKGRVMSSLSRIEAASTRRMVVGTGLLATIGAIGPFVGLLGTVWGIMNSFIGISQANTTNLAVVAPGIAEALLATALGLVAAIPAVMIYNHFTRKIAGAKALVSDSAAAVMRLVSRDLDRGVSLNVVKTAPTKTAE